MLLLLVTSVELGSSQSCPVGCTSWFDGCNNCGCDNGQLTFCTQIFCPVPTTPYCLNPSPTTGASAPASTVSTSSTSSTSTSSAAPVTETSALRPGEAWTECGGCDGTCTDPTPMCAAVCKQGYYCLPGYVRDSTRQCVPLAQCDAVAPAPGCTAGCSSWFDGCNTCRCVNGAIAGCTRKFCPVPQTPYCLDLPPTGASVPASAVSTSTSTEGPSLRPGEAWTDCGGCDGTCADPTPICPAVCNQGYFCLPGYVRDSMRQCVPLAQCAAVAVPGAGCPADCHTWNDGCNTCMCENGVLTVCTLMACESMGTPQCMDDNEEEEDDDDDEQATQDSYHARSSKHFIFVLIVVVAITAVIVGVGVRLHKHRRMARLQQVPLASVYSDKAVPYAFSNPVFALDNPAGAGKNVYVTM